MAGLLKGLFGKKDEHVYFALVTDSGYHTMRLNIWLDNKDYPDRSHVERIIMKTEDVYNAGTFVLIKYENGNAEVLTDMDTDDIPDGITDILRGYAR